MASSWPRANYLYYFKQDEPKKRSRRLEVRPTPRSPCRVRTMLLLLILVCAALVMDCFYLGWAFYQESLHTQQGTQVNQILFKTKESLKARKVEATQTYTPNRGGDTTVNGCPQCRLHNEGFAKSYLNYYCGEVKFPSIPPLPLCVNVSTGETNKVLHDYSPLMLSFFKILIDNPSLDVIDITSGLGTRSLLAAVMRRRILVIESCEERVQRLKMAAYLGGNFDQVTVLQNRIRDLRDINSTTRITDNMEEAIQVKGVLSLDDLRHVLRSHVKSIHAILLMDYKDFERTTFLGAKLLFEETMIPFVLVKRPRQKERFKLRRGTKVYECVTYNCAFLEYFGYKPLDFFTLKPLNERWFNQWPNHVLWFKKDFGYHLPSRFG